MLTRSLCSSMPFPELLPTLALFSMTAPILRSDRNKEAKVVKTNLSTSLAVQPRGLMALGTGS